MSSLCLEGPQLCVLTGRRHHQRALWQDGNLIYVTEPASDAGRTTSYVYNVLNQMTQVSMPRTINSQQWGESFTYDGFGNLTSEVGHQENPGQYTQMRFHEILRGDNRSMKFRSAGTPRFRIAVWAAAMGRTIQDEEPWTVANRAVSGSAVIAVHAASQKIFAPVYMSLRRPGRDAARPAGLLKNRKGEKGTDRRLSPFPLFLNRSPRRREHLNEMKETRQLSFVKLVHWLRGSQRVSRLKFPRSTS